MVPVLSLVFMAVTLIICLAVPFGGLWFLARRRGVDGRRRHPRLARAFLAGVLAFGVSQLVLRLPLLALVVPQLPDPVSGFLLSAPGLSLSAGLFEETGRLVVMVLLLRRFHRWVDGLAFGLGHGGLEALVITGLTQVNNLVLGIAINAGRWDALAAALPAGQAEQVRQALVTTPPSLFLAAGVERIGAIAFHVALSVLILWGVHRSHRLLAWVGAVLLHGATNWAAVAMVQAGVSPWLVEAALLAWGAVLLVWVVRVRPAFATAIGPDPRTLPPPALPTPPVGPTVTS